MLDRALYSIQDSRRLLGGISRNTIYNLMRSGQLASVLIGCRRFISADAIADLIARSTTTDSPSRVACRQRRPPGQQPLPVPLPNSTHALIRRAQS